MSELPHAVQLVIVALGTATALGALGLLPARLLLGARPGWPLAAPALGFATFAVVSSWLSLWLPMRVALWPLLALTIQSTGITIGLALARRDRWKPLASPSIGDSAALAALTAATLLLALAPALVTPNLIAIGPNWDLEIYLPLASALGEFPNGFTLDHSAGVPFPGLPNPLLWRINHFDPRSGGLAFSMLQTAVSAATGLGAHQTYIPTLAALFALAVPGYRLLFDAAVTERLAALATAAASFNAAAALVVFMGFGQQAAAAVLLAPLVAVALGWSAGRDRSSATVLAVLLAALLVTYSPVLPLGAALLGGVALGAVALQRSFLPLVRLGVVAAGAAVLAPFAIVRLATRAWYGVVDGGIGGLTVGPGVEQFVPLAWGLGLLPSPGVAQGWNTTVDLPWAHPAASVVLTLGVAGLAVAGAWDAARQRRWPLLGALAGCGVVLIALRLLVPYPYGFFKLLPSAAPFLLIPPAVGFLALARTGRTLWPAPYAFAGLAVATGVAAAVAAAHSSPHAYAAAAELERIVKPGERVCVNGGPGLEGPAAGAAAYFLRHADLYGYLRTGYSTFFRPEPLGPASAQCHWLLSPSSHPLGSPDDRADAEREFLGWRLARRSIGTVPDDGRWELVEPPRVDRSAGPGTTGATAITRWRADGAPDIESWTPPLLGVLAPTWGPLWRLADQAGDSSLLRVSTNGPTEGGWVAVNLKGTSGNAEAVLDIYREDGAVHYGYWRLGQGQLPGTIRLDLAAQKLTVVEGPEPPHETFPLSDGRYRGYLVRYRDGSPERTLPLFSFRLKDGVASEFVMETRGDLRW